MYDDSFLSFQELEDKLGLCFIDKGLLQAALTSRSFIKETIDKDPNAQVGDNERLEFLGDAVIELVVREYLYKNLDDDVNFLTTKKKEIVENSYLHMRALELGLRPHIRLGVGESRNPASEEAILSGALEALCAAIYLDQGFLRAKDFVLQNIIQNSTLDKNTC